MFICNLQKNVLISNVRLYRYKQHNNGLPFQFVDKTPLLRKCFPIKISSNFGQFWLMSVNERSREEIIIFSTSLLIGHLHWGTGRLRLLDEGNPPPPSPSSQVDQIYLDFIWFDLVWLNEGYYPSPSSLIKWSLICHSSNWNHTFTASMSVCLIGLAIFLLGPLSIKSCSSHGSLRRL